MKRGEGKRDGKKAQITLFVILALLIIVIAGILYFTFTKKDIIKEEFRKEAVPEEFKPVNEYVETCIHAVGVEAIKKLGGHGGYIDPLDIYLTNRTFVFNPGYPTDSELVSLTDEAEEAVPYYLHVPGRASFRNYDLESLAPSTSEIEAQLNRYINKYLPDCVGEFEELEEKGFEVEADNFNIATETIIHKNDVEFFVTYNLNISKENVKTKVTSFHTLVRFPLEKYISQAFMITASELTSQFLEGFAKALISYHSGVDYSKLPPFYAYTNKQYIVTWSNSKVKHDFQNLLLSYVPALQVKDTRDYQPIDISSGDVEDAFFKYLTLEIFNESLPDTSITFFYTNQPISLKVQPSKGDIIKPSVELSKGSSFLPQDQDNSYTFFYDISFPVFVEIHGYEPTTEIPEFSYMFALEANLIENKRVLEWVMGLGTIDWDYSYFNVSGDFNVTTSDDNGNTVSYKPRAYTKSLFCDPETWISGDINIRTADKDTSQPLEGVTLTYGCGDYDECWLGSTELTEDGLSAEWEGKLPICQGGYLTLSKEDYGSKTVMISTREGESQLLATQKLYKEREIDVGVKKKKIDSAFTRDSDWVWHQGPETLLSATDIDKTNEQILLTITQTGFEAGTSPISKTIIFGKEGVDKETIKLVPGDYEVTANLIDYQGFTLPGNCSRICKTKVVVCLDYEYYPNEDIKLNTTIWGGVEITEETTGVFKISSSDLDNNNEIEFYVLKLPTIPPGCIEHLELMNKIDYYSTKYSTEVMPVFK